jgi:hypothetical protein
LRATVRELLRAFLADYLALTEPDWAPALDFTSLSFLQDGGQNDAELGIAAEMLSHAGERITALVRIAGEPLPEREVAGWLGRQSRRLGLRLGDPVLVSVAALRGGRPGANLETAVVSRVCGDAVVRADYTAFGIELARAESFLERPEPLAWALSALMQPVRRSRAAHRQACLERIRAAALDEDRRRLLLGCVEANLQD